MLKQVLSELEAEVYSDKEAYAKAAEIDADRFDMYGSSDAEDAYSSRHESTPDFEKDAEEIVTMHEKAYRLARAKYNPFAVGGSENIHDFE